MCVLSPSLCSRRHFVFSRLTRLLSCSHVQFEEAGTPPEGSKVGTTAELQSKMAEPEDKVKDLEQKVANLYMDNVAL